MFTLFLLWYVDAAQKVNFCPRQHRLCVQFLPNVIFVCVAEHEALAGGIATTCIHIMSGHIVYNFVLHVYMQTGMHNRFVMFGSNELRLKLFCHGTLD